MTLCSALLNLKINLWCTYQIFLKTLKAFSNHLTYTNIKADSGKKWTLCECFLKVIIISKFTCLVNIWWIRWLQMKNLFREKYYYFHYFELKFDWKFFFQNFFSRCSVLRRWVRSNCWARPTPACWPGPSTRGWPGRTWWTTRGSLSWPTTSTLFWPGNSFDAKAKLKIILVKAKWIRVMSFLQDSKNNKTFGEYCSS